ncbi:GEVED domain-containing protein [Aquimarina sp. 2201CG5-10]|uniref:GEVED domain-containing protein n=1 Tax=Aquimarina callyspongiae TaxID=3098150 RepID=UPI002AB36622|nr:GEVED domain-containing protein [Aquimarina sp. 2201CG5-10]MDY8138064.1 GEVED domain-containing protein [Aquimarina sp. 2201CG5-10]
MKFYYKTLLICLFFIGYSINAQEEESCSFDKTTKEYYKNHPEELKKSQAFEKKVQQDAAQRKSGSYKAASKYVIPVVFHIYGNEWPLTSGQNVDVTEELVVQAVKDINEDFKGFNDAVDPAFANIEGGMDIEFKLAQIDPDGNTTNGVIFHETKEGFGLNGVNDDEIAKFAWDNYKYMNVHIQLIIKAGSNTQSGIAWFPATGMSDEGIARVVYNGRYMIYTPPASSLTHEFGHWLGLDHTFGGGGCVAGDDNGDKVADTPPTEAGTAHADGSRSCVTGKTNCFNQLINHENHMDYNPCESMFTIGQVNRMTSFLDHDARKPLWQNANLIATGVDKDLGARILFNYQDRNDSDIDKSLNFLEAFANDGSIQNKKRLKAVDGAQFAVTGNLQLGTHFNATGVPGGLTPVINVIDNNNATIAFTGKANSSEEADSSTVTITFLNPAITGGVGSLHTASGTFKIKFLDTYEVYYEGYSPFLHMGYSASNIVSDVNSKFSSLVIGGRFRTKLKVYDGDNITIDNFAQGFEVLCNTNTINAKYFAEGSSLNANSSGTWVTKTTSSVDSPPVLSSPSYTAWRNRTGYVAIRIPTPTNTYVYGWLRAEVSSDGEEADITTFALNPDPGQAILARIERPHVLFSSDRFLESVKNDGSIENEITVDLKNASFVKIGGLERGKHYTVENVPAGLLLKVNAVSTTQVKLKMEGVLEGVSGGSGWRAILGIKFKLLDAAFAAGAGSNVELKDFNFSIEKVGSSYTGNTISNATFNVGQTYTSPPGQFTLVPGLDQVSGAGAGYQLQLYPNDNPNNTYPGVKLITFRKDAIANNNYELTPLSQGTIIGPNSSWKNGKQHHLGRGQHMVDSETYTAWRGRTAYFGIRLRRSGRMHYGWGKMRVSSNGTQIVMEEYGINGTPDASIRAGQLISDDVTTYCEAASNFGPDAIKRVTLANIDVSTPTRNSTGYDNQTDHVAKLVRGNSYTLKVDIVGNSTNEVYAWFDWNQDKDFSDPNERVQVTIASGGTTGEVSINVPTNAQLEGTRMRLRVSRSNNNNPCGTSGTGEVEDYTLYISNEEIATCDDGIKNGDEEKIDCGGSCEPCQVFTEICEASTASNTLQITKVEFGSINNTSTHQPYSDFTSQTTNLQKGEATTLTVTLNNQWDPNQVMVWIDWYNDNDFFNTEDVVLKKSGAVAYTASVTPPADAVTNTVLRMRVRAGYTFAPDPCGADTGIGEVEDYTVTVNGGQTSDTQAPSVPGNLTASSIGQTTLTLNWTASTDNVAVTGYDVYRGATRLTTITGTSYNVTGLTANTNYSFSVKAKDAAGNESPSSNVVDVTTTGDTTTPTYCDMKGDNSADDYITNVNFAGINNTSSNTAAGYHDYTTISGNVVTGASENLKVTLVGYQGGANNEAYAWFDWNQDGDFTDADEKFEITTNTSNTIRELGINIPSTAKTGTTRMRIVLGYSSGDGNSPCGSISYGEVEDYTINVSGGTTDTQAPTAPGNLTVSNIAETTLTLNWAASTDNTGVTGYDVYNGSTRLATVTTTSYNVTGLTADTAYTFSVKAKDAAGNESTSSNTANATTAGGTTTVNYCEDRSTRTSGEFISKVELGTISNTTTRSTNGYGDHTSLSTNLTKGSSNTITITPDWGGGTAYNEGYGVWIDYNQDGDFADAGERVFTKTPSKDTPVTGTFTIPNTATTGDTRMRIIMEYFNNTTSLPEVCKTNHNYGETEDYTVTITDSSGFSCTDGIQNGDETGVDCGGSCSPCGNSGTVVYVDMADKTTNSSSTWNPFQIEVGDDRHFGPWFSGNTLRLVNYGKDVICEGTSDKITILGEGVEVGAASNFVANSNNFIISSSSYTEWNGKSGYIGFTFKINGATHYGWFYASVTANGSSYTILDYAYNTTAGQSLITERPANTKARTIAKIFTAYPNPFEETVTINVSKLGKDAFTIRVYDIVGKEIVNREYSKNPGKITLGSQIPASGNYFVKIQTNNDTETLRLIKY